MVRVMIGVAALWALGAAAPAAPLEAYGRLPAIETMALAPDGRAFAYTVTDGEKRYVVIQSLDTNKITARIQFGEKKLRWLQWAGPNHLIMTASTTGFIPFVESARAEWYLPVDLDLVHRTQHALLGTVGDKETLNVVDGEPDIRFIKGHPFAFAQGTVFVDSQGREGLFKVDLDHDDRATIVSEGLEHTDSYVVDAEGELLAESDYAADKGLWKLRLWKGHWIEVQREDAPIDTPSLLGLGRDGASVLASFAGDTNGVIKELSPDGRAWGPPRPSPDDLIWDRATYKLIGEHSLVGDQDQYTFYDPHDQAIWRGVTNAYAGSRVTFQGFSDDHTKVLLLADSPDEGPAWALVDRTTHTGSWLGVQYETLKPADIAPVRALKFKAKDGLDLTGYLTLPRGRPQKALPLVVFPHGGPAARDEPGFDWWAQAMASRGYAVLQVNYRGSEGLGWDFEAAGFGEWGRKMQTDLSDGVRYLAGQGIVDPARVCIVGASYGGYAALAGATIDTGVYRCAASVAGPSDLKRMVDWDKDRAGDNGSASQRYWLRYMGSRADLAAISPAQRAGAAQIPILLVHGKDDTVVPYEQSQIMADALRRAGKSLEFVTLKSEDHWLSRGETRLQMLEAVVTFLEKNNPPG
jgi:dienelactone hydrolase